MISFKGIHRKSDLQLRTQNCFAKSFTKGLVLTPQTNKNKIIPFDTFQR